MATADGNGLTPEQLQETLDMLDLQIGIAKRRRPRDVAGADHTAPARQVARLETRRERIIGMLARAKEITAADGPSHMEVPDGGAAAVNERQRIDETDPSDEENRIPEPSDPEKCARARAESWAERYERRNPWGARAREENA